MTIFNQWSASWHQIVENPLGYDL